jgi:flavin-dependent dehydrogenase
VGLRSRKVKLIDSQDLQPAGANDRIAVVGASAAGLLAALLGARAGREVCIFERSETLNPAPRTLIVTDRIRNLLGPSLLKCVVNEIRGIELFTDGRSAEVQLDSPDLVIERSHLICTLAQEAEKKGARFHFGRRFASIRPGRGGVELTLAASGPRSATLENYGSCFSAVIAADGAHSAVARAIGAPALNTAPLVQALVKLPLGMPRDIVRVWFVPEDTPYFYWLIPQSREQAALGLIGVDGNRTIRALARFMEKHHFIPLSYQAARIPVYQGWIPVERRIGTGRIFLVGDAAAQVKVTTLGGVVTGFRGALGVSETILKGGASPELHALRRELDLHMLIRRSIHQFRQADYSRLMDVMNEPMRRSLGRINRDQAARVLWHVCRNQPRLLWMGLRGLFARFPPTAYEDSAAEVSVWRPSVIQR